MTEIEKAIKQEMRKSLASLGAKPELLARIDAAETLHASMVYS